MFFIFSVSFFSKYANLSVLSGAWLCLYKSVAPYGDKFRVMLIVAAEVDLVVPLVHVHVNLCIPLKVLRTFLITTLCSIYCSESTYPCAKS